jgi:hypothetical protein
MFKKLVLLFVIFACCVNDVNAETHGECVRRVLNDIAQYEADTGKQVSDENKRLAIQAYCGQ